MIELIIMTVISVLAKAIEDCRKLLVLGPTIRDRKLSTKDIYEVLNFHCAISIGVMGYLMAFRPTLAISGSIVCVVLIGAVCKGAFSGHNPERIHFNDWDARWGLIIPNGIGIGSMIFGIVYTLLNK